MRPRLNEDSNWADEPGFGSVRATAETTAPAAERRASGTSTFLSAGASRSPVMRLVHWFVTLISSRFSPGRIADVMSTRYGAFQSCEGTTVHEHLSNVADAAEVEDRRGTGRNHSRGP